MSDRYTVSGDEGEFEPGSNDLILRIRKGITTTEAMDEEESLVLIIARIGC